MVAQGLLREIRVTVQSFYIKAYGKLKRACLLLLITATVDGCSRRIIINQVTGPNRFKVILGFFRVVHNQVS